MLPPLDDEGYLPPGIHWATWEEFSGRFGTNPYRRLLLDGLYHGLLDLRAAGSPTVYIDGSFVTSKPYPRDFDAIYELDANGVHQLPPVLLDMSNGRMRQKAKYRGEFFWARTIEMNSGLRFLDLFQKRRDAWGWKGIVALDLWGLP